MSRTRSRAQLESEALECLTLHNQGQTERQIVETLAEAGRPLSQSTVHRRIEYAVENYVVGEVEAQRKAALARLDTLYQKLNAHIEQGDLKAIEVALKLETRRAAMTGVDKPTTTGQKVAVVMPALAGRIEQAQKRQEMPQVQPINAPIDADVIDD